MIAFTPTEEQAKLVQTARGYAARHIAPLVEVTHRDGPPADVWGAVRPVVEQGVALGLTHMLVPEDKGGLGLTCLDAVLVLEEIGAADVGIASDYFALTMVMPLMFVRGGTERQAKAFLDDFLGSPAMVLAGAQSEPNVAGSELMMNGGDPAYGPKLTARREGEHWVLSGDKSAFITNAGVADHYIVMARTDPAKPIFGGLSAFHIPKGTPGFSVGRDTPLIGWPLTHHAQLHLDAVRLPPDALIGEEGMAAMLFGQIPEMPICLAACFVGLARTALDYAIAYAKERKSVGRPIAQQQVVALKLAEMARELHAARLMVWDAAAACAPGPAGDPMRAAMLAGPMAKAKAVDVAIRNAQLCVEVLGGYGVTREYHAARLLNDALIGYSCDFTREVLHLGVAQALCEG
jgi:alkylation response protein AidB-like acyl-CoA dehydrogenase